MHIGFYSTQLARCAAILLFVGFSATPGAASPTRTRGACGCAARALVQPGMFSPRLLHLPSRSAVMRADSGGPYTAKVYVADELSGTVSVIDARTNQRIRTIPISYTEGGVEMAFAPHNVQVAPDGKTVWITAPMAMTAAGAGGPCDADCNPVNGMQMDEEVIVVDAVADTVIARIPIPGKTAGLMIHLAHVVLDAESRYAYVTANYASQIVKIDAHTFREVARFELGPDHGPHGMRVCGGQLFVANMYKKSLGIVNPETGKIKEVPLGGVAVQTACRTDGKYVFATLYDTREIVRYELRTGRLTRIALPKESEGPIQLYVTPDEARVIVADQGTLYGRAVSTRVFEVDVATARVTAAIETGSAPHGVVIDDQGRFAYVSNLLSNTVAVVDLATKRVVATIPVGTGPNGIGYWFGTGGMP